MTKEKQKTTKFFFLDTKGEESFVLVFSGEKDPSQEFFSAEEWTKIQNKKIPIHYSKMLIHMDDSVYTVKQKITYARELDFNMEEIYLFSICSNIFHSLTFYKHITQNEKIPLSKGMLSQVLTNFSEINAEINAEIETILLDSFFKETEIFSYDDIMRFEFFQKDLHLCKTQIGHQFIQKQLQKTLMYVTDPLFACNPFDLLNNTSAFQISYKQDLAFSNSDFLFRYTGNQRDFLNNTIYVCLAKDVLNYAIENDLNDSYFLRMYYPLLWEKQIINLTELETSLAWRESSKQKTMDPALIEEYKKIDILEYVYHNSDLEYNQGIKSFYIILHPDVNSVFPLELIFKNIHAQKNIPFIEYNPGAKQEHLYRMYYETIAQNGKKIPFLSKETILSLLSWKTNVKTQSILLFVSDNQTFVKIVLEKNGNIHIQGELKHALIQDAFETWIYQLVGQSMSQIKEFMIQTGYYIKTFDNIRDTYVEIIELQYIWTLLLKHKLAIDKWMGCLSPLLYRELSDETLYRYKRVQYFKPMNPQEECIAELLRFTREKPLIADGMKARFPELSVVQIQEILADYSDKHQNTAGRFVNKTMEVMENPGFQISLEQCSLGNECTIRMKQISMYQYLDVLTIYFDSIIRLSQSPETIPPDYLTICTTKGKMKVKEKEIVKMKVKEKEIVKEKEKEKEIVKIKEKEESPHISEPIFTESPEIDYDMDLYNIEVEDEDEDEDKDEAKQTGGDDSESEDTPKGKATLVNYFNKRMKQKNPVLLKSPTGHVRVCNTELKRQPIIITEDEKTLIDEKYPTNKPYTHALNYGVDDKKKPLYYICPRYWCTKPGMEQPLTEQDVKDKKCGEIIKNPKNIKPGEYVYESTGTTPDPGFINRGKQTVYDSNGKEICYPCCFKDWDSNLQQKMRKQCGVEKLPEKDSALKISREQYVLDANKFPLPTIGRIGIIPIPVQLFLNIVSEHNSCIKDNIPKDNCPMLLRYGVEQYPNQSFLGCIADLYTYKLKRKDVLTVPQMREKIATAISLDYFVQMQNGSMVSLFQPTNKEFDVSVYKYENSELYKRLNMKDPTHISFFKLSVFAFENFLAYLRDNNAKIDHTYLWEIISKPHPDIFKEGMNVVILEIKNQDITNNVEILCPTAPYVIPLFDPTKKIALIIKQDDIFEPIYLFQRNTNANGTLDLTFSKMFDEKTKFIGQLPIVLKMLQKLTETKCGPFMETRIGYQFKRNIAAAEIQTLLIKYEIPVEIKSQVLNYQNKMIGFLVKWKGDQEVITKNPVVFLPVFPSPSLPEIHTEWMDNQIWNDYFTTTTVLKRIYDLSKKNIPCKPVYRILENEMIVGILTETNQFVQLQEPMTNIDIEDGVIVLKHSNFLIADQNILSKSTLPQNETVRSVFLESQFYNSFRSTVRMVMNLYKYRDIRQKMMNLFKNKKTYLQKIKQMIKWLKEMTADMILFQQYDADVLDSLVDIYTCNTCENKKYCLLSQGSLCQLIIPKMNLISQKSNEEIYYGRMADELLRHRRTHLFMFFPDSYLNITTSDYKIYDNEILVPKSALSNNSDYFNDLIPFPTTYSTKKTFEQTNPSRPTQEIEWEWVNEYTKIPYHNRPTDEPVVDL